MRRALLSLRFRNSPGGRYRNHASFGIGTLAAIGLFIAAWLAAGPSAAAPVPGALAATPAMWVVHGPKGTAYLFGSIHVLPKNVDWQTPQIEAAMALADTFVFELPMDADSRAAALARLRRNALLPLSTSLPSFFDEEMRADYRRVIELTGADPANVVYMRPWLAALVLQGAAAGDSGYVAAEGVDNKVYAEAAARKGVHFRALETDAQQLRLIMGDGNLDEELAALRAALKSILTEHEPGMNGLLAAWAKGDVKALAALAPDNPATPPEARKALFESRNRAWVPQIRAMLDERHVYFITVGAGHLVGRTGVPNLLRAAGYKVDGP